ncbi:MAG TPA: tetratricopeptide repeat protein [Anaerolineales bacterium]|nr:tetratricopeptide repeat protein [Anaerolineales bacterium]
MSENELWNELGNLYLISGAYREAEDAFLKSIQLDGDFGRSFSSLALIYVKQGEYEKAVELYKQSIALSVDPKEKAVVWNRLGNVYVQLKNYHEAVLAYQAADELEEKDEENFQVVNSVDLDAFHKPMDEAPDIISGDEQEVAAESIPQDEQQEIMVLRSQDADEPFAFDSANVSKLTDDVAEYQQDLSSISEAPSAETWADANNDWPMELSPSLDQDAEVYFPEPDGDSLAGWLPIPEVESIGNAGLLSDSPAMLQDDFDQEEEYPVEDQEFHAFNIADAAPVSQSRKYEHNEQFSLRVDLDLEEKPASSFGFAKRLNDQKSAAQIEYERIEFDDRIFENQDEEINEIKIEISKFKRVVQINPGNAAAWDALGTHYKSAGMYKDAILAYQQAISVDPTKGFYHHHLALVFAADGRNEDAIMAFQKVIEIDPEHSLANAALGGYYRKMGLEELAQKHIGKAMKNIYNSESEYNQACLEAICGNPDQAIELLRIALEEKQTYVNWVMHDPDLDAIREHPSFKQLISDFIK